MSAWLERFAEAHQHTISALEAISTFAAVVVSLALALLAHRSSRTRIKALVGISFIAHRALEGKPKPEYVTVTITNVGQMPVTIPLAFFSWKIPFHREYWLITPWDYAQHDPLVPQRTYPTEIKPRTSTTFFLSDLARFRTTMTESFLGLKFLQWRFSFIKAIVNTADGQLFTAKLTKEIRRELAKIPRRAKTLKDL
jgi:hypothetical protein